MGIGCSMGNCPKYINSPWFRPLAPYLGEVRKITRRAVSRTAQVSYSKLPYLEESANILALLLPCNLGIVVGTQSIGKMFRRASVGVCSLVWVLKRFRAAVHPNHLTIPPTRGVQVSSKFLPLSQLRWYISVLIIVRIPHPSPVFQFLRRTF